MLDRDRIERVLGERCTRLGLVMSSVGGGAGFEVGVELGGILCQVVALPPAAGGRALHDELRRAGRLAVGARYRRGDAGLDLLVHAAAATAPRGAMRKLVDSLVRGLVDA